MPSALGETVVAPPQAEAPGPVRHDLVHLAQVAAEPPSGAQKAALKTLAHELRRRAPDDGEARARVLVRLLDDSALQTVTDDAGVPLRALAAQALLELGFPHALQLSPEDLEAARRHHSMRLGWVLPLSLAGGLTFAGVQPWLSGGIWPWPAVAGALLSLGAGLRLVARRHRWVDFWARMPLGVGTAMLVLQSGLQLLGPAHTPSFVVPLVGALLGCAALLNKR